MVEVEVRPALPADYDALEEIDQLGNWPSLSSRYSFDLDCQEYTVALVEGRIWGFLQGHHDALGWQACTMSPAPPETWTVSSADFFTVHPDARGHGLGGALLRDFMARSRAAGSQWMMLHPAECGAGTQLSPAMRRLCAHAGLRFVEPSQERRRRAPWLMATPLVDAPDYHFRLAATVPPVASAPKRRTRPAQRPRVLAHAA